MAVGRRTSPYSGLRFDVPQLKGIESAVSFDFDSLARGLVTGLNQPYLIRGFKIKIPNSFILAESLQIEVSDSAVLHSSATESGTILTVPAGTVDEILNSTNGRVVGSFQSNSVNYVGLDYKRITDTNSVDQTSGWSPSQKIEFQRAVPISKILDYRFVISTTGFGTLLPLYIVGVNSSGQVTYITKCVPSLFRLGLGGSVPDPQYTFNFKNLINPQTDDRREWINPDTTTVPNPVSVVLGSAPSNAFEFGDWSITSLKEWMDAVMTRLREITGSSYWYLDSSLSENLNLFNVWFDTAGSVLTGNGNISYNLVLEATAPIDGAFQSKFTDTTILSGQSYVEGVTSGARAYLNSFNSSQLIINSQSGSPFIFGETLYNRRVSTINQATAQLVPFGDGTTRFGHYRRIPAATSGTYKTITSWSFDQKLVTINCTAHGYSPGSIVEIDGLVAATNAPNGVHFVKHVISANSFQVTVARLPSGSPTVSSAETRLDTAAVIPYMPYFDIESWTYAGSVIKLTAPSHNFIAPVVATGDTQDDEITGLADTSSLKVGMRVTGTDIDSETYIKAILSATSVQLSQDVVAPQSSISITFTEVIVVAGLTASTNAPNGRYDVSGISVNGEIEFTAGGTPTGTAGVSNAYATPDSYEFLISVTDATPAVYDVIDVLAVANSPIDLFFPIGPDSLPATPDATGAINFDGVVATSTVSNPVKITSISSTGSTLVVTTLVSHGLSNASGVSVTLYGTPSNSAYLPYFSTFEGVSITINNSTQFTLSGITFPNAGTYTNPADADDVYARNPNNPYPGPIQWDSDLILKGIIGDKSFTIPATAMADGTPNANKFNVNGITGTAYLLDGEVAYIVLERDKLVSNGQSFSCAGGANPIVGSSPPVDTAGNPLVVGDFVKFEDEVESKWCKVSSVVGNSLFLINDRGTSPSTFQRPAKSGRLLYSKGSYDTVHVQPHYLVDPTSDVYWLAVRRDNGSARSKVYLKSLELEVGEVRQVNDNEPSNLLVYTGAGNEAAVSPNYTQIDQSGPYRAQETVSLIESDPKTRSLTFDFAPPLGFQIGDILSKTIGSVPYNFRIRSLVTTRTVIVNEDVSALSPVTSMTYNRVNYNLQESDNLTLGIRKEDRELAKLNTLINKPIYDESCFLQQIDMSGSGTVRSGSFIYKGTETAPTALAWVLHGNAVVNETIEGNTISMPGLGFGANSILVHIYYGNFEHGDTLNQNGSATSRTVNNSGNPPFVAPVIPTATEIVLPPNRRTQVQGSSIEIFPTQSSYKQSSDQILAGEELLVIANDSIRQAIVDYTETFGGPKAKISIVRPMPLNSRIRFRLLPTAGSAVLSQAGSISLQLAYNAGNVINTAAASPVTINAGDAVAQGRALSILGSFEIDGRISGVPVNGIFGAADNAFMIGSATNKPAEVWAGQIGIKTHASFAGSAWRQKTASIITTDDSASTVTQSYVAIPANTVARVCVTATARDSANAGSASFRVEGLFKRVGTGSVAAVGSPISTQIGVDGNATGTSLVFGLVDTNADTFLDTVAAVAYGVASNTLYWTFTVEYQIVQSST